MQLYLKFAYHIKGEITFFPFPFPFFLFCLCVCEHICMYVWMSVPVHACVDVRSWNLVSSYTAFHIIYVCVICMCVVCGMLCVPLLVQVCSGSDVWCFWALNGWPPSCVYNFIIFYFTFIFSFSLRFVCDLLLLLSFSSWDPNYYHMLVLHVTSFL